MKESLKDLAKTFTEISKERLKNPIVGTFIVALFAVNWKKILVVVFSDENIEDRILYVDEKFSFSVMDFTFWLPLIITVFYVLLLPVIMLGVDILTRVIVKKRATKAG